jgi:tetratricopeptide (TPR) repeat protein
VQNHPRHTLLICLGLALAVLAVYSPLRHCNFVNYDDNDYVFANNMVKRGLTWPSIVWAFTTLDAKIWHPLTWLSYLLDSQIYGLNPAGYHLTNLLLHLANSILLYLLLQRMTKASWPSALAAAFFGLHPLHVESVAWISERKDVLSALFWMLSVLSYVRYVEEIKLGSLKSRRYYLWSIVLFALGLMAKPMLVTLPFVLLLLDYWPLQRGRGSFRRLLTEKAPFFMLAAAASVVAFLVARHGGAVEALAGMPLGARLANVPISYARYIGKTFWPVHLAVLYPVQRHWPLWEVAGASLFLALVTILGIWRRRAQPYLAVGWFWFLGMLVPVIGLVQVNSMSMADRYDYLPGIGLSIMLIWAAGERLPRSAIETPAALGGQSGLCRRRREESAFQAPVVLGCLADLCRRRREESPFQAPVVLGCLAVAGCMAATWVQVSYWKDSETLFRHAIESTEGNGIMESNLGNLLYQEGRLEEALPYLERAVVSTPGLAKAHYNLGNALLARGRAAEALAQFEIHVKMTPDDPVAQYNLGNVLLSQGRAGEAIPHLQTAVALTPLAADYHYKLANALVRSGRAGEGISQYEEALSILPDHILACNNLAWVLSTNPDSSLRNGARAVELARRADQNSGGGSPLIAGTLAAAYAEAGKFTEAIATVRRALQLANAENNSPMTGLLRTQLALYQAGSAYRDNPPVPH